MLTPKTHRIRHRILAHLTEKRRIQQANDTSITEAQSTIDEIAKAIKADWSDVDKQLDVLWHEKSVVSVNAKDPKKYMVNAEGIALAASFQNLYDGMIIRSQIFNNYASGIFQIIAGLIALFTVIYSLTTIDKLEMQLNAIEQNLKHKESIINSKNTVKPLLKNNIDIKARKKSELLKRKTQ